MKKILIGVLFCLNIFLLVGIIFVYSTMNSKCKQNQSEKVVKNTVVCEKEKAVEEKDATVKEKTRADIEYSDDGTLVGYRSGVVIQYLNENDYKEAIANLKDSKYEKVDPLSIYHYSENGVKTKLEDGKEIDMWYKSLVQTYEKNGFQCK